VGELRDAIYQSFVDEVAIQTTPVLAVRWKLRAGYSD
jgi:hypothetical protein